MTDTLDTFVFSLSFSEESLRSSAYYSRYRYKIYMPGIILNLPSLRAFHFKRYGPDQVSGGDTPLGRTLRFYTTYAMHDAVAYRPRKVLESRGSYGLKCMI